MKEICVKKKQLSINIGYGMIAEATDKVLPKRSKCHAFNIAMYKYAKLGGSLPRADNWNSNERNCKNGFGFVKTVIGFKSTQKTY